MKPNPIRAALPLSVPLLVLIAGFAHAQESRPLTVDWIQGSDAGSVASTMTYTWLPNTTCVLYDLRKPASERTLELLTPSTGLRSPLVDAPKALASLRTFRGDSTPAGLPFPTGLDASGRRGVYLFGRDIFLLEFGTSAFARITETPDEEKCVQMSPDGAKISFVRHNDLFVYDIASGRESRLTSDGSATLLNGTLSWVYWEEVFGRYDTGYWWSPDSKAIAFLQSDDSLVSLQHYVDVQPWTPRVITQRYPKVGEPNPRVRAGIVDLASRKTTWVDLGGHQYEYLVRVQWMPDGSRLSLQTLNRMQTELSLFFVDRAGGAATFVLKEADSSWVNVLDGLYFLRDGSQFIWPSERSGYQHLYLYSMDGRLVRQLTRGAWTVRASGDDVAWLKGGISAVDEKKKVVFFTALEKSSTERHLYRVGLDGSGLKRISEATGTHVVTFSRDAQYYLDRFSSSSTLPSLALHDAQGRERILLARPRPELLQPYGLQYPTLFTIPARDGFLMPAQILKPAILVPGMKYPVIFYVYSGPAAPVVSNSWQREILWENLLLKNGYIVLRCDNRSATGVSKTLETTVLHRLVGEGELHDLVDAVHWAKAQGFVDSTRIGIWGWSGGGSCTLLGMTRSSEFKAGIAVAGVTDFRFYDTKWAETVMKTEAVNAAGFEQNSLLTHANRLHGKLLLVHGTYDDNVHIQNTWAFTNALIKANIQFEMMIYPMRMHGIADLPARIHLYTTMLDFWKRNL